MKKLKDEELKKAKIMFENLKTNKINMEKLNKANENAEKLGELAEDFILVLKMVKDCVFGDFKLTAGELASFIGAIAYVVSPVDAIPDVIPFIGYLDDLTVLTFVLKQYSVALNRYRMS